MRFVYGLAFYLILGTALGARPSGNLQSATSFTLIDFDLEAHRTLEVFQALAERTHIGIGVSGELIGSGSKLISIVADQLTFTQVLDQICSKDPRYKWHETPDGNVGVTVGKKPLDLIEIVIGHIKVTRIKSTDVVTTISQLPEVKAWTDTSKCNVGQVFMGGSFPSLWELNIDLSSETLSKLLNEVAVQSKTYFWSAIKFSEDPCAINLQP